MLDERAALPLLLASDRVALPNEREPLDQLRVQKGIFLLQKRGPERWRLTFPFVPWDWGPYSQPLARALSELLRGELLEKRPLPLRQYPAYRTTSAGEQLLSELKLTPEESAFVGKVRRYVTSRSFNQLLREVYAEYPEYATHSRFRG